ncbi:MAG: hypothetical protein L0287_31580 [Anaerolineae bacterium]|nr:hypothetical protein [Anaerolineae bacterium]MCI0611109.1 hypothetical protein [Anaerolineae bacterium]
MKTRVKVASTMLLFALVLSLVPAATMPTPVSAAVCYRAQFIADVTVPDGTTYDPGATFKKTWRLRNIGDCAWNSVSLIFDSGTQMSAPASVPITSSVSTGQTVDVSVDMTAPNAAGHYIGYWKLKASDFGGIVFGIGVNANKAFWVEINVKGTPITNIAYDFTANAGSATWSSGAGGLSFPGTDGDAKGFALKKDKPKFESGVEAAQAGLLFAPQSITNGFIQARYPAFRVESGDRFQTTVGCEFGATSCYVAYRLDYEIGNTVRTFWTFRERYEGWTYNANLDLTPLAGQDVRFVLYMSAWGSSVGDRAIWGNPVIVRKGVIVTPTGTPPTATPTRTPGQVTVTVPPSACDKAQFIADVNIPDGTTLAPGATFTKTWRLKNVGTCAWNKSYQLVFSSGPQMGGPSSAPFPLAEGQVIAVGQTVDVSINLTAPSAAGSYRGFWMFKNASGALFGIGKDANRPWWVDIKVSGPTVTPGGPTNTPTATVTPGGPTVTPGANMAYDFAGNACLATWVSGAGTLPCPGTDGDAKGFVLKVSNPKLESGTTDPRPALLTFPQNTSTGYIQATFPAFRVQNGDRFRSRISCEGGATSCFVEYRFEYQIGSEPVRAFRNPFRERYEGNFFDVDVDLSFLAGRDVKFILTVHAYNGSATGDRALWVGPHIYRASSTTNQPDLTITQVLVELQNPSCLLPNDKFGLRVGVANRGPVAAGSFVVKSGDLQLTVDGVAAGETKVVFLPNYVSSVGNAITVVADANNTVAESNEQNNTFSGQIPVPTQPLPCTATPTATPTATSTPSATATATP